MAALPTPASTPPPGEERVRNAATDRPFRVIVVGGGVSGLVITHALCKAGIDHVILEKGVVAPDWGASISLWGNGSRILAQLGVLDALEAEALPLKVLHARDQAGKVFSEEAFFDMMLERNGFEAITMERRNFLRIVYEQLPDKSKILTGKRVCKVVDDDDGVMVECTDGSTYEGDILIGSDGVHSKIRELMWQNANEAIPGYISAAEKRSLITTYRSLVGVAKTVPGLGIRDMHWVCHRGLSFLLLTQPDKTYFFVNWKMPQQMRWPTKAKWSNEEAEEAAASVADLPISDTLVFGELWKNKLRAHLIGLEEGIFEHWSFGRTALCGDSAHKVTPNFALGANCAMESVVTLLNGIVGLHKTLKPGQRLERAKISKMLQQYRKDRLPRMQAAFDASAFITRLQAFDGNLMHFIMRYIFPAQGMATYADQLGDLCSGAPKFEFLPPAAYDKPATFKWKDDVRHLAAWGRQRTSWKRASDTILVQIASLLSVLVVTFTFMPSGFVHAGSMGSRLIMGA